ncbi:hypothetical protein [Bartonella queenslandensis]|uniref:hypothetical protein n=1 Tax=Bartonella queenslandensis TaxID=481138 RepID=UPI0002DF9091|nr:hypothetical protein [Bartonella queenslandensis]
MGVPLLLPLAGAAIGAGIRYVPHIFRFFAPKVITGANRLVQLIAKGAKHPSSIGAGFGTAMMLKGDADLKKQNLQNMLKPYGQFMPYTAPGVEMPLGVDQQPPMPNVLEEAPEDLKPKVDIPQTQPLETSSQTPPSEPTDLDKFLQSNTYKFFQSDAYQKLKDLFAGMAAAPSDGSGWDALASGVKHLNEGDKQRGQVNQTVEYLKSKGYSEEEARSMAGNKYALNEFFAQKNNGGNRNPQFTSDGRMLVEDPNAPGGYRYVMVEGGKAYQETQRAEKLRQNSIIRKSALFKDIKYLNDYIKEKGDYASGFIAWVKSFAHGRKEYDADKIVTAIKERIANDRIEELKQLSRTGSVGTGNTSDKDLDMLKNTLGSLHIGMSASSFKRSINIISDILSNLHPEQAEILLGEKDSGNEPTMSIEEAAHRDDITVFRNKKDGKLYKKEEVR